MATRQVVGNRQVVARLPLASKGEAKLALFEFLLTNDSREECAQQAVDWLAEPPGAEEILCLSVGSGHPQVTSIAAHGLPNSEIDLGNLDLEDRNNPFVSALTGRQVVVFEQTRDWKRRHGRLPLAADTVLVVPLFGDGAEELPAGVLLMSPVAARVANEARSIATALGQKLASLKKQQTLAEVERRLSRESAQLHRIVNAVSDPILLTDVEGRMIIANARAEALFASVEGESEGRRRAVALNNMLLSAALSQVAITGTEITRRELPLVDPSEGSDLLYEMIATLADDAREGTGIVSVLRNVTDLRIATEQVEANVHKLRIAEAKVRAERDRLELVIDSVADPILVTDPSGNIVLMNTPAERLFTLVPTPQTDEAQRAVRANDAQFSSFVSNLFFSGSARWTSEFTLLDPATGEVMPFEAVAGKVTSEQGELTAVVTILHDRREALEKAQLYEQLKLASSELERKVTDATQELVRQNELLQEQHFALEQASKLKSQFLANVSHEFRTPLNAILGYTSMLLQGIGGQLTPQQQRNLGRVDSNGRHLLAIINDILDISKIEAGKASLEVADFNVGDLVSEVMAEMEPLIARSKLAISSDVEADMPIVRSDRKKLKQILMNLVSNALKFTPQGAIKVCASHEVDQRELTLSVADTGIGIAEEHHLRIFEDFRQVDSSPTREYGGTGLGLAICRRYCSLLGARMTLQSTPSMGSTFFVHLPRSRPK